jgi:hypothetical protein
MNMSQKFSLGLFGLIFHTFVLAGEADANSGADGIFTRNFLILLAAIAAAGYFYLKRKK